MFRLCIAQAPADLDTPDDRLDWLRAELAGIGSQAVDLVLLPELFACGYNIGDKVTDRAEPVSGPTFAVMSRLAKQFGVAIHYGFAEQDGEKTYNSAVAVSQDGAILSHQRKLAIPPGFERTFFSPGQGCDLFDYRGLRMATLICYDAEFPETVRHVAAQGAELVLVPTALGAQWASVADRMMPTRAFENGVYLAYANSAGVQNGMQFLGRSVITAPDGEEVWRAGSDPELIFADVDRRRVKAAQDRLPYLKDRFNLKL